MQASEAPSTPLPVFHSLIDPAALSSYLALHYAVGTPILCSLFPPGINDSYLVRTDAGCQYVLRVYRMRWHTDPEIRFEIDALRFLADAGVPVSVPIARREGTDLTIVRAPEGDRQMVLFTFAPGQPPDRGSIEHYRAHGRALAAIHAASGGFRPTRPRPDLEPSTLIAWSLAQMEPYFRARADDWAYLCAVAQRLVTRAGEHGATDWGFCHGDPYIGNAHITEEGSVTFFDFDCCGIGWRAYDLAGVRWFLEHTQRDSDGALWTAFLAGYRAHRPIPDADVASIPYFVAVRTLWHNALGAWAASLGIERYDEFGKRGLVMLREWDRSMPNA